MSSLVQIRDFSDLCHNNFIHHSHKPSSKISSYEGKIFLKHHLLFKYFLSSIIHHCDLYTMILLLLYYDSASGQPGICGLPVSAFQVLKINRLPSAPGSFESFSSVFSRFVFVIFCYVNNSTSSISVSTATINQTLVLIIYNLVLYLIYIIFSWHDPYVAISTETKHPPMKRFKRRNARVVSIWCRPRQALCMLPLVSVSLHVCLCSSVVHKRLCSLGVLHPFQLFHVLPSPRVS